MSYSGTGHLNQETILHAVARGCLDVLHLGGLTADPLTFGVALVVVGGALRDHKGRQENERDGDSHEQNCHFFEPSFVPEFGGIPGELAHADTSLGSIVRAATMSRRDLCV